MTNVSTPEVNMLKNSSALAVSVPINLSIKLSFVSVNGSGETYFVDEPRRLTLAYQRGASKAHSINFSLLIFNYFE